MPDNFADLAVVDPPYGNVSDATNKGNDTTHKKTIRKEYHQFENIAPTPEYWQELKRVSKNQIIWGGNWFGLSGGVIAWNKNGTAFGEGEIAICTTHKSVVFFEYTWNGMIQGNMKHKEIRIHPCHKPVALYSWILQNYAKPGDKILDTHLGSQSSRIAAYKLGFDFYGCELDEQYFREGCERFDRECHEVITTKQGAKIVQQSLF
jgi:site-specific DNA-methyltransferase (adenine-specific)